MARRGALLLIAGAILVLITVALPLFPTSTEEPASPGKTPNPSKTPWYTSNRDFVYAIPRLWDAFFNWILPGAGFVLVAAGLACILIGHPAPRKSPILGVLLIAAGFSLVGVTAWQYRVRTAPMEPANLGTTPYLDEDSPFLNAGQWTQEESDRYWARMRWRSRTDMAAWRAVLYCFPTLALALVSLGLWMMRPGAPVLPASDEHLIDRGQDTGIS